MTLLSAFVKVLVSNGEQHPDAQFASVFALSNPNRPHKAVFCLKSHDSDKTQPHRGTALPAMQGSGCQTDLPKVAPSGWIKVVSRYQVHFVDAVYHGDAAK